MDKNKQLQTLLSIKLLGKIPLFFNAVQVQKKVSLLASKKEYKRDIEIEAYQTDSYEARGYHKSISKII